MIGPGDGPSAAQMEPAPGKKKEEKRKTEQKRRLKEKGTKTLTSARAGIISQGINCRKREINTPPNEYAGFTSTAVAQMFKPLITAARAGK